MVIKGLAKPFILKTYKTERRSIAQELIAFDQEYSRIWSSRPKKDLEDQSGVSMAEFEYAFIKQQRFSSGFGIYYCPSILITGVSNDVAETNGIKAEFLSSHQHLASKTIIGRRFPSFKVINHSDAQSWHLANWLPSDGLFTIFLFAGDVSQPQQMDRVRQFAAEITNRAHVLPVNQQRKPGHNVESLTGKGGIARLLTIHSAPRQQVELHDFPPLLIPYNEELGHDYDSIFVDGDSYYEGHGRTYEGYGIDRVRGCVVVVRPDQHVAWVGELEGVKGLEEYFARFLVEPKVETRSC